MPALTTTLSSRAANFNIKVDKYATYDLKLTWKTGGQNPQPIPFTGARALLQVRRTVGEQDVLYEMSSMNNKITLHPTSGLVSAFISEPDSSQMTFSEGVYDLIVKLSSGRVYRVLEGEFLVIEGVSRFT